MTNFVQNAEPHYRKRIYMKNFFRLLSPFLFLILLSGCVSLAADVTPPPNLAPQQPATQPRPEVSVVLPMIEPDIQNGEQIYEEKCAACHGESGMGDGVQSGQLPNPVPAIGDFSVASISTPFDWYSIITVGNIENFMPGFQSLSDRERWDVTSYVMTLSLSEDLVNTGEIVFNENCVECHTGENLPLKNASAMAEMSIFDIQQVVNEGVSPDMPGFADVLSDEEKIAVSSYVRYLGFDSSSRSESISEESDSSPSESEVAEAPSESFTTFNLTGNLVNFEDDFAGIDVVLTGYDGMEIAIQETSQIQADGTYEFSGLENVEGRVYQVGVVINGMQHSSEVVHNPVIDSSGNFELPIEIKKTSNDNSLLYAERMHVFFEFITEETIQVIELYVIENPSDSIIVPKDSETPILSFQLPSGYQNLQFEQGLLGQDYLQLENGFGIMNPIAANSSIQLLFGFELPYSKELDLDLNLPLPVNASIFMLPSGSIKFSSDQLMFSGERNVQGMNIQTYSGEAMEAGEVIRVNVSGKVKQSSQLVQTGNTLSIIIGSVGLLLAVGVAFYFIRKKQNADNEEIEPAEIEEEDLNSLLDAVIALDDSFGKGGIPQEAYINRRNELTKKIKLLTKSED